MNKTPAPSLYDARADFLKALAHPGRLYMVDLLSRGEMCVNDLAIAAGYDISTVSRHLSQMKRAAIVRSRREGTTIYYSLHLHCIKDLFRCIESAVEDRLDMEKQHCACSNLK
jgi:DNA-binding transcriptional ArsR family regulator